MTEVQSMTQTSGIDMLNLAPEDSMDVLLVEKQEQKQLQQQESPATETTENKEKEEEQITSLEEANTTNAAASDEEQQSTLLQQSQNVPLTHQQIIAQNTLAQLTPMEGNDVHSRLLRQVEFYFSDTNLPRDKFLKHLLGLEMSSSSVGRRESISEETTESTSPTEATTAAEATAEATPTTSMLATGISCEGQKFVPLEILLGFNKIKCISEDIEVLREAIRRSAGLIKMNKEETGVTRTTPLPDKPQKDKKKRRKSKPKVLEIGVPGDKDQVHRAPTSVPNTPVTPGADATVSPAIPVVLSFADELDLRTVLAECLPQGYDRACLERDFSKYGPIESIELDQAQGTTGRGGMASIVFAKLEDAQRALADLEETTKGGAGEQDWRRQSMKVKSKKDWLVNRNVNTRNRRPSIPATGATLLLNAGIPLVPQQQQQQQQQPQQSQIRRTSTVVGSNMPMRRSSLSGDNHVVFNPQVVRREYTTQNYTNHILPNFSFGESSTSSSSSFNNSFNNNTNNNNGSSSSASGILAQPRRKSTDSGQPFASGTLQRRLSVSNVVGGGHVSFSTSAQQPQGQSLQPAQQQPTQPIAITRRNSLADTLSTRSNRMMSPHGILSVNAASGSVQNNFRVVYSRGPDNSRGFAKAIGRGKAAAPSGSVATSFVTPGSMVSSVGAR